MITECIVHFAMLVMAACGFKDITMSRKHVRRGGNQPFTLFVVAVMPKILFSMFKEVKLLCSFMVEFHTDHSFQQALCNRVDRVRFLHHDIDFSVAY